MATKYISPTGNDSTGNGTSGNPWLTIQKALASTTTGDTIHVFGGANYTTWSTTLQGGQFGVRTIVGDGADTTVVDFGAATVSWYLFGNISFSGIRFQNGVTDGTYGWFYFISIDATFTNCIFQMTQSNPAANNGIFVEGSNPSSVTCVGCVLNIDTLAANNGIFQNSFTGTAGVTLLGNTFYSNFADAATSKINGGSSVYLLKNNIFYNANGVNKAWSNNGSPTYDASSASNLILGYSSIPTLTGTVAADPLLVDPTNFNFNLRPGSPAIDAGVII